MANLRKITVIEPCWITAGVWRMGNNSIPKSSKLEGDRESKMGMGEADQENLQRHI